MEHTVQSHTDHPMPSTREDIIDIVNASDPFPSCTADKLLSLILDDPTDPVDDNLPENDGHEPLSAPQTSSRHPDIHQCDYTLDTLADVQDTLPDVHSVQEPNTPYVLYEPAACIIGTIGGQQVPFLVDTGSCITIVDRMFLKGVSIALITEGAFKSARAANGKTMPLYGVVKLTF